MVNLLFTLTVGILLLILVKIGQFCYKYVRFCRLLRKLPTTADPGHWLIGNLREGQVSSASILILRLLFCCFVCAFVCYYFLFIEKLILLARHAR